MTRLLLVALILLALCGTGSAGEPTTDLATAVERAAPGSVVRALPGRHSGPVRIERPITIIFEPGAVVAAREGGIGIEVVQTEGVTLDRPAVRGGKHGIVVRHSTEVRIDEASTFGAGYHGIFAQNSEVTITDCRVGNLREPVGQGVEIINSDGRPPSAVRGCVITGPAHEGIVSHVSKVTFADNTVVGTTERGVSITEMSQGRALRNVVQNAAGTAYWCGDMSMCTFLDNVATDVAVSTPGFRSSEGHGLVVQFHSHAALGGFEASGVAGRAVLEMSGSTSTPAPSGRPTLLPLVLFGGVLLGAPAALARLGGLRGWQLLLATAFGVQVLHQAEHGVQVAQAKVLGRPEAHGLAGAAFDNEWVHLEFNTVLFVALVLALAIGVRTRALLVGIGVQAYHEVEHVAKVVQHVRDGLNPAPGFAGAHADLVWFHFSINLVVTVLVGAAVVSALRRGAQAPSRLPTSWMRSSGWTIAARTWLAPEAPKMSPGASSAPASVASRSVSDHPSPSGARAHR